jgi:hypothetical protein
MHFQSRQCVMPFDEYKLTINLVGYRLSGEKRYTVRLIHRKSPQSISYRNTAFSLWPATDMNGSRLPELATN